MRGIEGKINAARVARERGIPFLGICLGMQLAVVDFARHVVGMAGANSAEFDPETPYPVVDLLPEQKEVDDMGGTMRLGADPVKLHADTRARAVYDEPVIYERHRHRYEVNNLLRRKLEEAGLVCSGTSPDDRLVEVDRAAGPPVLHGLAVPPRVQVAAQPAGSAVPGIRGRRAASARGRGPPERRPKPRKHGREPTRPRSTPPAARAAPRTRRPHASRRSGPARRFQLGTLERATDAEKARLVETFVRLCEIESPTGREAAVAAAVRSELEAIGLDVEEDDSAAESGADCGNLTGA